MTMKKEYVAINTLLLCLAGGCTTSPGGVSDILCFEPVDWVGSFFSFSVKVASDNLNGLLLSPKFRDGGGVGPTYHFDPNSGSFNLIDDGVWEQINAGAVDCLLVQSRESPFSSLLFPPRTLFFEGDVVSTIGRNGVSIFYPPSSPSIVYVSTDGDVDINGTGATGQLYYQVFYELDGSALAGPVRIGITGRNREAIRACFSLNEKYVVFSQNVSDPEFESKICIGEMP